jgi:hypothetical protein
MAESEDLDEQVDGLYGLALDQFTAARDQLVRRLREAGEREAAAAVKQLRRPSLVAWSLNQVRRHSPEPVQALLAAGDELRRAQQQLLAGGEHGVLREAVARERSAVEAVARLARQELAEAGRAAGPVAETKLWQTLQAAARDESTRELLATGRLLRETEISDLGLGGGLADDATAGLADHAPAVSGRRREAAPTKPSRPRVDPAVQRKIEAGERRLGAARERQRELEEELAGAERAAAAAREDAERAAHVAERSEHTAEQAEAQVRRATERSRELEAALAELRSTED